MSDFDVDFMQHPFFILKRIREEDYSVASNYIVKVLDEVEKEVVEEFVNVCSEEE